MAKRDLFTWKFYIVSRLCRLWIVLVPALLHAAALVPFTPLELLSGEYRAAWASGPMAEEGSCSPVVWLGNLFFLRKIFIPVYRTDGPLWSLAYEFWYYVLFPLLWIGIHNRRLGFLVMAGILMPLLGGSVLQGFLFWLFGAAASLLSERIAIHCAPLVNRIRSLLVGLGLVMVISAVLLGKTFLGTAGDRLPVALPLALSFAFLVFTCSPSLWLSPGHGREFLGGLTRRLSESSFSLYVLHLPLICALVPRIAPLQHADLGPVAMSQFAGMILVCVLSAVGFASLTEWRTPAFRRWVMNRLQLA